MKINERWEDLKEASHANIQSEKGILKRKAHAIQTEEIGAVEKRGQFCEDASFCKA